MIYLKKILFSKGVNNESVAKAKYCSYGDAVVEETGIKSHIIFSWDSYFAVNAS